jgi:hypothetical protein
VIVVPSAQASINPAWKIPYTICHCDYLAVQEL